MDKKQMRKLMLEKRNLMSEEEIIRKSKKIHEKIENINIYQRARNIMLFASFGTEVYTYDMIKKCMADNKNVLLPYIEGKGEEMKISPLKSLDDLAEGYKGILEVKEERREYFNEKSINLIITPCVCYDMQKYRIGYGKGFYDRFFTNTIDAFKLGICFDEMLVDKIEYDSNDIKVDMVITDKRTIL